MLGQTRKCKLLEYAVMPFGACLWRNAFFVWCSLAGVVQGTASLRCVLGWVVFWQMPIKDASLGVNNGQPGAGFK